MNAVAVAVRGTGKGTDKNGKEKKPAPPHIAERVPVSAGKARRVKITRA